MVVKRHSMRLSMRKYALLYLLMLPGIVYLLLFRYLPMGGLIIAFKNYRLTRGIFDSPWVGIENFQKLFKTATFSTVLGNTVAISFMKLLCGFPAPIIVALMLNEVRSSGYKRTLQTVMYMPHFLSWVVVGSLIFTFFAPQSGVFSQLFQSVFGRRINIMINPKTFRWLLVLSDVWKGVGWGSIIYLATLSGIDPTLYEAAVVDGANRGQQLWYISLPELVPTIMTMLLMRVGHILNTGFEQIYVLQNALVSPVSEVIDTYVYQLGFAQGKHAVGAAAGLFQSFVGLCFVLITNRLAKHFEQEVL